MLRSAANQMFEFSRYVLGDATNILARRALVRVVSMGGVTTA